MLEDKAVRVWITKYALTEGITCRKAEIVDDVARYNHQRISKPDWYLTQKEAIKRAEGMRDKKIKSLKKSLAKMEGLKFEMQQEDE